MNNVINHIKNPKVSVIIPTYNQSEFISETIESVLSQTYSNIEIIITDDGSTDGTVDIIKKYLIKYPNTIKAIFSEKNTGISSNFNRALELQNGDLIAWLGGDDVMLPDKIKKQVECLLAANAHTIGCSHDAIVFESDSGKTLGLFSEIYNGRKRLKEGGIELLFDATYFMLPSAMMFWSKYVPKNGFDQRLKYANDWLFDIELFRNGRCVVINEPLVKYRRHHRNVTDSQSLKSIGHEEILIALAIVEARYPELHSMVKKRKKAAFLSQAIKSFKNHNYKLYKQYLIAAIREGAFIRGIFIALFLFLFGNYMYMLLNQKKKVRSFWMNIIKSLILRGRL